MNRKSFSVVLLAAGSGSRFGGDVPKQWTMLGDRYVAEVALAAFASHPSLDQLVLVVAEPYRQTAKHLIAKLNLDPARFLVTIGGDSREASTFAGLQALSGDETEHVLIHDAARPLITSQVVDHVVQALANGAKSVVPVLPVPDTLKRVADGTTVDRSALRLAQTPQGFDFQLISQAHQRGLTGTDDCALMEQLGHATTLVEGNQCLHKITTQADKLFVEAMMAGGFGIDD